MSTVDFLFLKAHISLWTYGTFLHLKEHADYCHFFNHRLLYLEKKAPTNSLRNFGSEKIRR